MPFTECLEDKAGLIRLGFVLFCSVLAGCRPAPAPVAPALRFVEIDNLIAQRPLWKSPRLSASEPPFEVRPQPEPAPLPPLSASTDIPETQAEERQQTIVVQNDTLRRRFARSLEETDVKRIEREASLKRKELYAVYRRDVQELAKRLTDIDEGNRRYIAVQVQNLGYYEVIYKTALEQQGVAEREQRFAKLERVRKQIRGLQAILALPKPDAIALAETQLKARLTAIERQISDFRATLTRKAQEDFINAVTQAGVDLQAQLQAISPLKSAITPTEPLRALHEASPPPQLPVYQAAQVNQRSAEATANRIAEQSRSALEAGARRDTLRAVEVLFAKHGWKRVEPGTRGATDATDEISRELAEERVVETRREIR